jgi:hypothetical protein
MLSFKQFLIEVLDPKLQAQLDQLDRRKKEREQNKKLQTQLDAAFAQKKKKEEGMYNIPGMPNLSANIEFSSQSRARSGSGIATPETELDSFYTLGKEKQERIAPGLSTSTLTGMQKAQYGRSKSILAGAPGTRMTPRLNQGSVEAQNIISKTLEDRKGPLGGKAGAQSYVERLNRNTAMGDVVDTQKAIQGKSYKELSAMRDELDKEIRSGFSSGNKKIDPTKRKTMMDLDAAISNSLKSDVKRNI